MEDGDEFHVNGYRLQVIHTPGHSPGMCCLYEPTQKVLFSGDHILNDITPNPIIETNRDGLRDPNYQSLMAYKDSLQKIAAMDVKYVFPGHDEYSDDLPQIISEYRDHHRQRADFVLNVIRKKTLPLYHLVRDVFPNVSGEEVFLALSEVIAHLEVLISQGKVEIIESGPPALYRAL
jgi:glyoxylase-like metal-dependent hydrolase (beta-lactamase superfamily II)